MTTRLEVFQVISEERVHQDKKWGSLDDRARNGNHSVGEWLLVLEEQVRRAKEKWYAGDSAGVLSEVRQVAAVGVACMEQHGAVGRE